MPPRAAPQYEAFEDVELDEAGGTRRPPRAFASRERLALHHGDVSGVAAEGAGAGTGAGTYSDSGRLAAPGTPVALARSQAGSSGAASPPPPHSALGEGGLTVSHPPMSPAESPWDDTDHSHDSSHDGGMQPLDIESSGAPRTSSRVRVSSVPRLLGDAASRRQPCCERRVTRVLLVVALLLVVGGIGAAVWALITGGAGGGGGGGNTPVNVRRMAVTSLPGLPSAMQSMQQYTGYIDVGAAGSGRSLFYWFIEAETNAAQRPLVLWLNGGPGCSSLLGLLSEVGPFWATADGTLARNVGGWTQFANMLFVESPAAVGFSVSSSGAATGDDRTASELHAFMSGWYEEFPQYATRDFYMSGESFAGHYLPAFADVILARNKLAGFTRIPLRGYLVGNPYTDGLAFDDYAMFEFLYTRNIIPGSVFDQWKTQCMNATSGDDLASCRDLELSLEGVTGNVDWYNVFKDVCLPSRRLHARYAPSLARARRAAAAAVRDVDWFADAAVTPPCIEEYIAAYLNRADVQAALHIKNTPVRWDMCSDAVWLGYNSTDFSRSMLPTYRRLLADGSLRLLVYSGDVDAVVAFPGTIRWIDSLQLPVIEHHRPWLVADQVAGYTSSYAGLNFTTIRHAGHMVPSDQPMRALYMFERYLAGQAL